MYDTFPELKEYQIAFTVFFVVFWTISIVLCLACTGLFVEFGMKVARYRMTLPSIQIQVN
jgi:uncharacterized membrane protein YccC